MIMKNLIQGKRYLFYRKSPYDENSFRANFKIILGKTLIVNSSENESSSKTEVSIPVRWITNVVSLEEIMGDSKLPLDVIRLINEYW
jgi:hypothetical protein